MPNKPLKGYSYLIKPLQIILDLLVVNLLLFFCCRSQLLQQYFIVFVNVFWLGAALFSSFYAVYRFTDIVNIFKLLFQQIFLYTICIFTFFGVIDNQILDLHATIIYVASVFVLVGFLKLTVYYSLQWYRKIFGGNKRRILVFGNSAKAKELIQFFTTKQEMGYALRGVFFKGSTQTIEKGIELLKSNKVDELYCCISELTDEQINEVVNYCDNYSVVLKFIPDTDQLPTTNLHTDYYHYSPVVSIPRMKLHLKENITLKRFVDIVLSLVVIVGILSWLIPLLFVLIKSESKGPLFYKHVRNGINYGEFTCYKFRSMRVDGNKERLHVTKEDERVTKLGRFLRRSSIDELPQFWNVLKGQMSVVGPRPHMPRYTAAYAKKIDKFQYVFRHSVKPGITGLAQVKGYRGEITSDDDIINRIKFDVYYIQNWSLTMDLNIIFNTFIVLIKGQEKAY